jgi:hypothetical protein
MPRIYLASSFALIPKVVEVSNLLESHGNKITTKWWEKGKDYINIHSEKEDTLHPENFYSHPKCKMIFDRDYKGIENCQILVLVAGDNPSKFNGANIELGIAYALNKTCFSIGKIENSALYFPLIKCETLKELDQRIYEFCIYPCIDYNDYDSADEYDDNPDCLENDTIYDRGK